MKLSVVLFTFVLISLIRNGAQAQYSPLGNANNLRVQGQNPIQADYFGKPAPVSNSNNKAAVVPSADLALILKNVEAIDFVQNYDAQCCGRIAIINSTISSEAIKANGTSVLTVSNYGQGRAAVLASHLLFQERALSGNKNWVFLLRNLIKYAAKATYAKYEILALGINPSRSFKDLLKRSGLDVNITFAWDLNDFVSLNKSQFQVILIGDYSLEFLKPTDSQKITQYVTTGGGIITTYRPECSTLGPSCFQLNRKCLHNTFLNPIGIRLLDGRSGGMIEVRQLQYNTTEKMNLTNITIKKYEKRVIDNYSTSLGVLSDDYNFISNGVANLKYGGAGFSTLKYSEDSYISVVEHERKSVMIAGRFGSGKIFFCGHDAILKNTQPENTKLFSNIISWMTGNKTSFKVGFLFDNNTDSYTSFSKVPGNITKSGVWTPADLQGKDIICVSYYESWPTALTTTMLTALKSYVQNGGKIFFGSHGWVWESYGEGSKNSSLVYELNFASFVIAKQFNVYLRDDYFEIPDNYVMFKNVRQADIENFLKNDLLKVLQGQATFTANESKIAQYISRIQSSRNFSATICDISLYHSLVDAFVQSRFNIETNYSKIDPTIKINNDVYKIMNALSYAVPPLECRALPPSLNIYPGYASKLIPNKTVAVYRNQNFRFYTGLYINPGEAIRIANKNNFLDNFDVTLVIHHGDDLYDSSNGKLSRFPSISKQFPIKSKDFNFSSPHGGIIFFKIEKRSNLTTPLTFQILGAYEIPYFNQNIHTAAQFALIKQIDAPFFIIQTKKFVHIGPTKGVFGSMIIPLVKLCNFWNKMIQTFKSYRGVSLTPFQKDSAFNDIHISGGYMHSGLPVMTHDDVTFHMLGWKNEIFLKGSWGIYHQFGHNHQDYKWTTDGTVQVTCNIYSLYLYWVMQGVPIFQNQVVMKNNGELDQRIGNYMSLSFNQKLPAFNQDSGLALFFYMILMDEIGYEIFSTLHKKYDTLNVQPKTEGEKHQLLVEQLSLVVGKNLWKYFYSWGMLVTEASKNKISHLPDYKCVRYPYITL